MRVLSVVALAAFALASSSASLDHNTRKAEREAKHAVNEGAAAADGLFASASRAAGDAANVSASLLPSRFIFVVTRLGPYVCTASDAHKAILSENLVMLS
jgi:hypothetical protein